MYICNIISNQISRNWLLIGNMVEASDLFTGLRVWGPLGL